MARSFRVTQRDASRAALRAHEIIPESHWCVTRQDLRSLRAEVKAAVAQGAIRPTDRNPFSRSDDVYGPNVHTVVAQYIAPQSVLSGGLSYALAKHPGGLKCDLFITHCWSEGIYEFIDKTLYSWPRSTKHAYCCFLSNPQNLVDIGGMVSCPSKSPFAKALRTASHVLVVPNRASSVYSRSWCCYEAYLACAWDKEISVASRRLSWARAACKMTDIITCTVLSLALHSLYFYHAQKGNLCMPCWVEASIIEKIVFDVCCLTVLSYQEASDIPRWICLVGSACRASRCIPHFLEWYHNVHDLSRNELLLFGFFVFLVSAIALAFFPIVVLDQMLEERLAADIVQLKAGYTGNIRDSQASVDEDKAMILKEIRDDDLEAAVNNSIDTLLNSGMLTQTLRAFHEEAVDIEHVAVLKWRFVAMGLLSSTTLSARSLTNGELLFCVVHFVCLMLASLLINFGGNDKVGFTCVAIWKLIGLPYLVSNVLKHAGHVLSIEWLSYPWEQLVQWSPGLAIVVVLLPALDLAFIVSLPVLGRCLAQSLVTTKCVDSNWCCDHCCRRKRNAFRNATISTGSYNFQLSEVGFDCTPPSNI